MSPAERISRWVQTALRLGPGPLSQYALYQFGLRVGHFRRALPIRPLTAVNAPACRFPLDPPDSAALRGAIGSALPGLLAEADAICAGQVRLFGGPAVPLQLVPPAPPAHWTAFTRDIPGEDIKFIWEPARFAWAFTLMRAYHLTHSNDYAQFFWERFEQFNAANPPNQGPNWASAQEVALRLIAFLFAARVFAGAPASTPARQALLAASAAAHAMRIPPTLPYARAQNNNHLLAEALGLYAAGLALPEMPQAARWRALGWRELQRGLVRQIAPDGSYAQHSLNYHRVMLHLALLGDALGRTAGDTFTPHTLERLAAASRWLLGHLDRESGHAPNLGSNDGALTLPLACADFGDLRPTAQAAARAFLTADAFPPGPWDELSLWLGLPRHEPLPADAPLRNQAVLRLDAPRGWASLRAVHYTSRPFQSDQLHVEIWHNGENLARDPGTYRYNAPAPWDNALTAACVHNTLIVDGRDPMRRAGRFLWLDWAQAHVLEITEDTLTAEHHGYRRLGLTHRRTLARVETGWQVRDDLLPRGGSSAGLHTLQLHWLLPDALWDLDGTTLTLQRDWGQVRLSIKAQSGAAIESVRLIRAGEVVSGPPAELPVHGWFSPTYNVRLPALSLLVTFRAAVPSRLITDWEMESRLQALSSS